MSNQGIIIGLCGPSAVGKGYIKDYFRNCLPQIAELTVATTRPRRPSDCNDRDPDIPEAIFLQKTESGEIIFAHQPFGAGGHWYGFYDAQLREFLEKDEIILTEIHVDNVVDFKRQFGDRIMLIALVAEQDYLAENLASRGTESEEAQRARLNAALVEVQKIMELHKLGYIHSLIMVNQEVREQVAEITDQELNAYMRSRGKEIW